MVLNPITPHGSVVVNAAYDYTHFSKASSGPGGDADVNNHRIEKKDLVFCNKTLSKRKRSSYNEPDLHVLASTNGVSADQLTHDNFAFIGVSHAHIDANSHRHAAVTVAGLTTIKNTGPCRIEVGDKVVWDLADHSTKGSNKRRKVFRTLPYDKAFESDAHDHYDDVLQAIRTNDVEGNSNASICAKMFKETGLTPCDFDRMKEFLKCYTRAMSKLDSRVVGTALSKADENGDFDILIRHAH